MFLTRLSQCFRKHSAPLTLSVCPENTRQRSAPFLSVFAAKTLSNVFASSQCAGKTLRTHSVRLLSVCWEHSDSHPSCQCSPGTHSAGLRPSSHICRKSTDTFCSLPQCLLETLRHSLAPSSQSSPGIHAFRYSFLTARMWQEWQCDKMKVWQRIVANTGKCHEGLFRSMFEENRQRLLAPMHRVPVQKYTFTSTVGNWAWTDLTDGNRTWYQRFRVILK